jgi:hypothetical protein
MQFPLTLGSRMRGAVFARCSVAGTSFVVVGAHLSTDPEDRNVQAAILGAAASEVDGPLVLAADAGDTTLAQGLVDAVPGMIFVSPGVRVTASHRTRHRGPSGHLPEGTDRELPVAADIGIPSAGIPSGADLGLSGPAEIGPPNAADQGPKAGGSGKSH